VSSDLGGVLLDSSVPTPTLAGEPQIGPAKVGGMPTVMSRSFWRPTPLMLVGYTNYVVFDSEVDRKSFESKN